jgi:phosphoglycerol transferase MdoB-like AlkP superfamily enzyme
MEMRTTRNLIFGLLAFGLVLLGFLIFTGVYTIEQSRQLSKQNTTYITCVLNWANKTNHRSSELTDKANVRQVALDSLIRDVAEGQNPNKATDAAKRFRHDLKSYIKASDAYNKANREHPIPKSPKLACANVKK